MAFRAHASLNIDYGDITGVVPGDS